MKDFTRPKGRLRSLSFHARAVYTVFLAFTLVGLGMTMWLTDLVVGLDLSELGAYYAGKVDPPGGETLGGPNDGTADGAGDGPAGGGPLLDLPLDEETAPAQEPMSVHKLLEVTHFHLFSMPVYLLILSHLFMLSRMGDGPKTAWIGLASVSTVVHVAAPWIARADAPGAGLVYGLSGAGLGLSYLVMAAWPLWEMWAPIERRG